MSKPKEYSAMTKDRLMLYTFIALLAITIVSAALWSQVTPTNLMTGTTSLNLGLTVVICALISVGVAVGIDALFYKLVSDSPLNLMSAAVYGLIVTLSYSLGLPSMNTEVGLPVDAPGAFVYVGLISLVGMVLFKKVLPHKFNPAAAAKFLVLLPLFNSIFIAVDHLKTGWLGVPALAGPLGGGVMPVGDNGMASFASYLQGCFANPATTTPPDVTYIMIFEKFHGWVGGASSIAVIIAGIALFVVARRFIKWRITLAYFATVALMSIIMSIAYADTDMTYRLLFSVFIGSSIFMGFFMATDPATTPLTYTGQLIFGVGLGVLTILIQTYMNFFGGSILALLIMNLTVSKLDQIGKLNPRQEKKEPKLPKAKQFPAEKVKEYACIKCGACMRVCCHNLSPILIKQAYDKQDFDALAKLHADYCTGCGHCTFICPARIDLRKSILTAKGMMRQQ
ncbi:MAG: RnfABCDGE type electron transport complex subunit D [Candidatus Bathyarchaeia archaeon]|jgi:electron transport complex protein RnfD